MKEIFKPINGYEDIYEISNFGRVRRLYDNNHVLRKSPRYLKPSLDFFGYARVNLFRNKKFKTQKIHILVWEHFGDQRRNSYKLQVDHIDGVKSNNIITNLQLLTPRENTAKARQQNGRVEPTGVGFHKFSNKYRAYTFINGKQLHIGLYKTKEEAYNAYMLKTTELSREGLF